MSKIFTAESRGPRPVMFLGGGGRPVFVFVGFFDFLRFFFDFLGLFGDFLGFFGDFLGLFGDFLGFFGVWKSGVLWGDLFF